MCTTDMLKKGDSDGVPQRESKLEKESFNNRSELVKGKKLVELNKKDLAVFPSEALCCHVANVCTTCVFHPRHPFDTDSCKWCVTPAMLLSPLAARM